MPKPEPSRGPECNTACSATRPASIPTVRSDVLLGGGRELQIVHGHEVYRLLVTRNNKLILQK
jgi:hemin uptake protein HemP